MEYIKDVAALIAALVLLFNTWQTWAAARESTKKLQQVAADVKIIELATNSMKDALVAATAKASLAEGTAVGLERGRAENEGKIN